MSLANLHTLQDSETDFNSEFKQQRFAILKQLEGSVSTPYFDAKGIITIGIGFNIDAVRDNRNDVMTAMGLTLAQQAIINDTAWDSANMDLIRAIAVPPVLSSGLIWSPIPPDQEIGREEAVFRRTDHRLSA